MLRDARQSPKRTGSAPQYFREDPDVIRACQRKPDRGRNGRLPNQRGLPAAMPSFAVLAVAATIQSGKILNYLRSLFLSIMLANSLIANTHTLKLS